MPLYITFIKIEHSMNICNKYFKTVIDKETTNIHSGVQIPTVSKRKSDEKHSALEFHDTVAGFSTRLTISLCALLHSTHLWHLLRLSVNLGPTQCYIYLHH